MPNSKMRRVLFAGFGVAAGLFVAPQAAKAIVFVYACLCCRPDGSIVYKTGWLQNGCAGIESIPIVVACDDLFTAFTLPGSGGVGGGYAPAFDRAVMLGSPIPGGPGTPETRIVQGYYPAADQFNGGAYTTRLFAIRPAGIPGAPNQFAPIDINVTGLTAGADGIVMTTIRLGETVSGPFDVESGPIVGGTDATIVIQTFHSSTPTVMVDLRLIPLDLSSLAWENAPDLPPACLGDCDRSGMVAFGDVTSVLANFGATYPVGVLTPGDGNGDRVVNFSDVTAVLANFGTTCM